MKQNEIVKVECFVTNPHRHNLVVVKVSTSQGITGLGCATYQQRPLVVQQCVENYLAPLLIGRDASRIEDLWHLMNYSGYWRQGPILNSAIGGIDMALWDIKSKQAQMPLVDLFGGATKDAIALYSHADGETVEEVVDQVKSMMKEGYRFIRCQLGLYGGRQTNMHQAKDIQKDSYYDPQQYCRSISTLFKQIRQEVGDEVELLHDIHERLSPQLSIRFIKELEEHRLFMIEDCVSKENSGWLDRIRQQTTTPLALGELFNSPQEWMDLITQRKVDIIRVHVSQIGGITPALKLAALCDLYGVQIIWHGPSDMTPIAVAVNLHLGLFSRATVLQEYQPWDEMTQKMFPNELRFEEGYLYPSTEHGIGVEFDEELAKQHPNRFREHPWAQARTPDGTLHTP